MKNQKVNVLIPVGHIVERKNHGEENITIKIFENNNAISRAAALYHLNKKGTQLTPFHIERQRKKCLKHFIASKKKAKKLGQDTKYQVIALYVNDKEVGCLTFQHGITYDICFMNILFIFPEFRNKTYGTQLISEYLNFVNDKGLRPAIEVAQEEAEAMRAYYNKWGFKYIVSGLFENSFTLIRDDLKDFLKSQQALLTVNQLGQKSKLEEVYFTLIDLGLSPLFCQSFIEGLVNELGEDWTINYLNEQIESGELLNTVKIATQQLAA